MQAQKRIDCVHVAGKLTEERFNKMLSGYESEQSGLASAVENLRAEIAKLKNNTANLQSFMNLVAKYGEVPVLTEEIARAFIEKVVVYEAIIRPGSMWVKLSQQVDIYLTYIGQFDTK
jgi:hypothetical protein